MFFFFFPHKKQYSASLCADIYPLMKNGIAGQKPSNQMAGVDICPPELNMM